MANFTKLATAGVLGALLSTTPALAQGVWEDEGWDLNGDGVFDVEEFREGFRARLNFEEWDLDRDGLLSEEEFGGAIYSRYDADGTEAFEETEYSAFERDFGEEGFWGDREIAEAGIGETGIGEVEEVEATAAEGVVENEGLLEEESELAEGTVIGDEEEGVVGEEIAGLEAWDIDGDGVLLRNEFEDGFREWGTFGEFDVDMDGGITEDEFVDGVFARYDEDGTGFIEEPELTDIGDDMGDEGFWDV